MTTYHRALDTSTRAPFIVEFDRVSIEQLVSSELHSFALEIGAQVISQFLEEHVERLCGARRSRGARQGYRYGKEAGYVVLGGQKVRIERPRVRSIDNKREIELSLYRQLQQSDLISAPVVRRLMKGVSCRNYLDVVDTVARSIGVSASSVSRSFVDATTALADQLMRRRFEQTRFPVILIDGVCFQGTTLIAAIGVNEQGVKRVLSVREGATENAQVCVDLLEELRERGVSTDVRTLFILDGSKALRSSVLRVWGENALIQRCRVHKLRNVQAYVPEQTWPQAAARIRSAYAEPLYAKAKRSLESTARWLDTICPAAGASLREGLEETLTVVRLKLPSRLRRSLSSTNMVENVFSRVRTICGRVKRWRPGMRLRWCAAALLEAERTFHRVPGAQHLNALLVALDAVTSTARVA